MEKRIEKFKELIETNFGGLSTQLKNVRDIVIYDTQLNDLPNNAQNDLSSLNDVIKIISEIEKEMFPPESEKIKELQSELEESKREIERLKALVPNR